MMIAGEEDQKAGAVSFRYRNGEQKNGIPIKEAVAEVLTAISSRAQI
jgi:threonyl-tRNA synthetase